MPNSYKINDDADCITITQSDEVTKLTDRQVAYREVCLQYWIEIGNTDNSSGEDSAEYFPWRGGATVHPAGCPVGRYCAVTFNDKHDIHYTYPDFDTLDEAKRKAEENITDSMFPERPIAVVDLDTGEVTESTPRVVWGDLKEGA